jgi:hypothetical protein
MASLRLGGTLAWAIAVLACGASPGPAADAPARSPVAADCGDMPDPNDVCPLLDGCPGDARDPGRRDDDGCPGPGGIPTATDCRADEARVGEIAREIQKRPGLTTLRIVSSVPGCSERLRRAIVRSGVRAATLVAVTRGTEDPCAPWAHFEIASWEGRACP